MKNLILSVTTLLLLTACGLPKIEQRKENNSTPFAYTNVNDSGEAVIPNWKTFFSDSNLIALIDTALIKNQELLLFNQELEMRKNEIQSRKGEYLPFVNLNAGAGMEKEGLYTRKGAIDEQLEIKPGEKFPKPFTDYMFSASASWEVDIWKKLRSAKKSAVMKFMAGKEGRNLLVTNLVAEIASDYYELLALDNLLTIVEQNIEIQNNAFQVILKQKEAGRVTQLAVNRFEAQLLNTKNLKFELLQKRVETENRLNFLTGRFPSTIPRAKKELNEYSLSGLRLGVPALLLRNRPDIRQFEFDLKASHLDVQVARARFLPSIRLTAGLGYQAFRPELLLNPYSLLYNLGGDLISPLINRNALTALYKNASASQMQAVISYEQGILNAYVDVINQLRKVDNYSSSLTTKIREVEILKESIQIANNLFNSARADYAEVLFTQREALEAKMELIEIKQKQLQAQINLYRALGGGWN